MIDGAIFRHLRKKHDAKSAGRNRKNINLSPTDMTDLLIEMTTTNIRELMFRAIKVEFANLVAKMKRLHIFDDEVPVLYSKRIDLQFLKTRHVIVVEIPDALVTPQVIDCLPFNVPVDLFNMATYDNDNEPKEILVDSIKYNVKQMIGKGSYGKCFELISSGNAKLACKVIRKNFSDIGIANIAQNELKIHKNLHHQNIVQFINSFEDEKHTLILMDFCPTNLSNMIKTQLFFEFEQCTFLIRQVLSGVCYLHQNQIIHRDLKLSNVLLDQNQQVKICDFGLSIETNASYVQLRQFCGTIAYAAPETIYRRGTVTQSDIWSIAVMLFYMYKAKRPFDRPDDSERQIEVVYNRIRNAQYTTDTHDEPLFVEFVAQVFKRDPEDRPSAHECLAMPIFANNHLRKYQFYFKR